MHAPWERCRGDVFPWGAPSGMVKNACSDDAAKPFPLLLSDLKDEGCQSEAGHSSGLEGTVERLPVGYQYEEIFP